MDLLFLSLALLLLSGLCSLLSRWVKALPQSSGPIGAVAASAAGLLASGRALLSPPETFHAPWALPGAAFALRLDALCAAFLLPLFLLCAAGAVYSLRYVRERKGLSHFLYNFLAASMALVFTASNSILFLAAWELMAVSSFLFVVWDAASDRAARHAGWIYLIATHIGTAFLLALFALGWNACGSADFQSFPQAFRELPFAAVAILSVLGFGTKAGFFPLHVWLPKAHPAAPSHVSALMSGVMIKTGIYGLVRMLSFYPQIPHWFGWTLAAIGAVSALMGVILALSQRDLKQMLAYSSVENTGIIALGLGFGYLASSYGHEALALLAFSGAFLHVINHSAFKGLLFLGSGAVYHETGTRNMEELGGLRLAMPVTAGCFLAGSAAIAALPPFNGFISELLIYIAAFKSLSGAGPLALAGLLVLSTLASVGALAAACFAQAYGITFLGLPRAQLTKKPQEAPAAMLLPMLFLAALCAVFGLAPFSAAPFAFGAAGCLLPLPPSTETAATALKAAALSGAALALAAALLWLARGRLLRGRQNTREATWGCAYAAPTARMQYTASSFSQPILQMLGLGIKSRLEKPQGLFPAHAEFHTIAQDAAGDKLYKPLFEALEDKLSLLRKIQHGNIHAYILYIALTLIFLLGWALL